MEIEPDLLLTPNTELGVVDLSRVEYVLVDPGIPREQSVGTRFRRFMKLLSAIDGLNPRLVLVVIPDDWEPRTNVRMFRHGLDLLRTVRPSFDYVPVLYIHGFHKHRHLYEPLLRDMDLVVGVPTRFNTLDYPNVVRCRDYPGHCARDIEFALREFSRVHFGGTGLNALRTISAILNSPFSGVRASYTWLSADTMAYRWDYSYALPFTILSRPYARQLNREYINAFMQRLTKLHF